LPDVDLTTMLETLDMAPEVSDNDIVTQPAPVPETAVPRGGLAAAIARSQTVKQELELTARQRAQQAKLKKI
jgi:hypothetical protein